MRAIVLGHRRPTLASVIGSALLVVAPAAAEPKPKADPTFDQLAEELALPDLFAVAAKAAPVLESAGFSLDQARARFTSARGAYDLTLFANGDYSKLKGAIVQLGLPGLEQTATSETASIGLRKLIPTNGTFELFGTATAYYDRSPGVDNTFEAGVRARLTQPLLRGFGPAGYDRAYDSARFHASAAVTRRAAAARAYALTVARGYWELALAWEVLAIRRDAVELAKHQVAIAEGGIRTGKFSDSELLPPKQAMASRQQDVMAAELDVINQSVALRLLVGMDVTATKLAVKPPELPNPDGVELDAAAFVSRALATSDDLKAAVDEDKSAKAELAGAKRDLLPRADLRLEGGPLGTDVTGYDITGTVINHNATFGNAVNGISGGYEVDANLTFELPIGNHAAGGVYDASRAAAYDAAFQVGKTRREVAAEAARAVYEIQNHAESAKLGATAVEIARANVDAEQKKFELGKSSSQEIIRRQDDLGNVRLREAIERARFQESRAELDALTGEILEKSGLRMLEK